MSVSVRVRVSGDECESALWRAVLHLIAEEGYDRSVSEHAGGGGGGGGDASMAAYGGIVVNLWWLLLYQFMYILRV